MNSQHNTKTLLITNNYPSYDDLYQNAFVHSRISEYKTRGLSVDVFKFNGGYPKGNSEFNGISITSGTHDEAVDILQNGSYDTVLVHFLSDTIWNSIKSEIRGKRLIVWLHGFEVQSWTRRKHNFPTEELQATAQQMSDKRTRMWNEVFNLAISDSSYSIHFVFISDYLANCAFEDVEVTLPADKYSVIHNYINSDRFVYRAKSAEMRTKILSIRPFANQNYANDLTVKAILELSNESFFNELSFTIIGRGELFESTVEPLRRFPNVRLEEKFLRQEEIAELHKDYGIFLVPTRMDTQGVSRDEAMSSGLVPITNKVEAIPEFTDEHCCIAVDAEDYKGLAEGIKTLYLNPALYQSMSEKAAERVRQQSGFEQTIVKEMELIYGESTIKE